ncbi:MAG: AI-2E family transporter [Lachnospiraceae bacterium]|nr:AI-2E family transporter [Lachnospiraceae bacterium]
MKFKFNKKYLSIAMIAFGVIVFSLLVFFLIYNRENVGKSLSKLITVLKPVLYGMVIAYLFTPMINFFERKIFIPVSLRKKDKQDLSPLKLKVFRVLSIILSMTIVIGLISVLLSFIVPQLVESISSIVAQIPEYQEQVEAAANATLAKHADLYKLFTQYFDTGYEYLSGWFEKFVLPWLQGLLVNVGSGVISAIRGLWNFLIGAIISIYVMLNKELFAGQAKKIAYSVFSRERANLLIKDCRFVSATFLNFIVGKIVDSMIIGVICFICSTIIGFPYPLLISVIIGVTNIIPVFGPFLGAIPSALLILLISPKLCLYFIIFVLILQQVDGNIIGPKILGSSTGISGFWVIFAITLFGGLWGIGGMFIGIPFFAVIYALIKRHIDRRLTRKEMPVNTWDYLPVKRIEEDGSFVKLAETEEDYYIHERDRKKREREERKEKRRQLKLKKDASVKENLGEIINYIKQNEESDGDEPENTDD